MEKRKSIIESIIDTACENFIRRIELMAEFESQAERSSKKIMPEPCAACGCNFYVISESCLITDIFCSQDPQNNQKIMVCADCGEPI
ncbi:MAG: hypothetical protein WC639_01230 [Patescibacteria group bacterium]|jgi:hypothetical protein